MSRRKLLAKHWRSLVPTPLRWLYRQVRSVRATAAASTIWQQTNPTILPDFASRVGLDDHLKAFHPPPAQSERENHYRSVTAGSTPSGYEIFAKFGAAFNIERRFPFQDPRLIEFCLALPARQKLSDGYNRSVMRRALAGILPDEIRWRADKVHFSGDMIHNALTYDRPQIEAALFSASSGIEAYVDVAALRALYQSFVAAGENGDLETQARRLFQIYKATMLAIWLRRTQAQAVSADGAGMNLISRKA